MSSTDFNHVIGLDLFYAPFYSILLKIVMIFTTIVVLWMKQGMLHMGINVVDENPNLPNFHLRHSPVLSDANFITLIAIGSFCTLFTAGYAVVFRGQNGRQNVATSTWLVVVRVLSFVFIAFSPHCFTKTAL